MRGSWKTEETFGWAPLENNSCIWLHRFRKELPYPEVCIPAWRPRALTTKHSVAALAKWIGATSPFSNSRAILTIDIAQEFLFAMMLRPVFQALVKAPRPLSSLQETLTVPPMSSRRIVGQCEAWT